MTNIDTQETDYSVYPLINGFCQDSWHLGVDRDWSEGKDRQLWVEIGINKGIKVTS